MKFRCYTPPPPSCIGNEGQRMLVVPTVYFAEPPVIDKTMHRLEQVLDNWSVRVLPAGSVAGFDNRESPAEPAVDSPPRRLLITEESWVFVIRDPVPQFELACGILTAALKASPFRCPPIRFYTESELVPVASIPMAA